MERAAFLEEFGKTLNEQQKEAVLTIHGPVLLLAVPGSGKTTVLVTRLGYMILCAGIQPEQILTITYTVNATADMRQRFSSLFGPSLGKRLPFRTINGLCASIIRLYEIHYGRQAFALISDERELNAMVGEIYRTVNHEFPTESTIKTLRTAITYIKNMELSGQKMQDYVVDGIEMEPIYRGYCLRLRGERRMDYDDQMVYALQILNQCPDLLQKLRRQYPYICVDEAQDTSKIQHRLIGLLAGERPNLFMVGDEDQSIYGFRAAWPQALLQFQKVYQTGRVLLLEKNYRSVEPIVKSADAFIQVNRQRRPKHMVAVRPSGKRVEAIWVNNRQEQYRAIVELARGAMAKTAVLFRNNDSAIPMIDLLERAGVPYNCRPFDTSFFSHKVVRDIVDIIRLAMEPDNSEIFLRVYYKFNAGITKTAAEEAAASREPAFAYLAGNPALRQRTRERCYALQTHLACLLRESGIRALRRIVYYMGYMEYLERVEADPGKIPILEALSTGAADAGGLLTRLEELRGLAQKGRVDPSSPFVLSTIHASKGLEYHTVYLADVLDGTLPCVDVPEPGEKDPDVWSAYEEERRLFYVAMTRAKDVLSVYRFRDKELPSSFADEIFGTVPSGERTVPAVVKPMVSREVLEETAYYRPGQRVIHSKYGSGILENRKGDIISVRFASGDVRQFSLEICLQYKQLKQET